MTTEVFSKRKPPSLTVSMDGPRVGKARLSAAQLAEIIRRTQQALKQVGQVLYGESSAGKGRKKRDIEELCELFLVGWKPGSAVAELEMGEPPAQLNLFGYIGEESLQAFLNGMGAIAKGSVQPRRLPLGFDEGVLQTCDALGKMLDHGIETIRFEARNGKPTSPITFDTPLRERVRGLLGQPVDVSSTAKIGRLEVLSGHGHLTGRLWEADGTRWTCLFKSEHLDQLPDAWMHTVKVVGRAEEGKDRTLHVESIIILEDENADARELTGTVRFWKTLSLDELAEEQGISPADDLDEISDLWPQDDDPDDFLAHVLSERTTRRKLDARGENP